MFCHKETTKRNHELVKHFSNWISTRNINRPTEPNKISRRNGEGQVCNRLIRDKHTSRITKIFRSKCLSAVDLFYIFSIFRFLFFFSIFLSLFYSCRVSFWCICVLCAYMCFGAATSMLLFLSVQSWTELNFADYTSRALDLARDITLDIHR